jgi:hypothetical protein
MSKHTSGPWTIRKMRTYAFIGGVGWDDFARVVKRLEGDDEDSPEGIANAHLIAAAPDLLEALKAMVKHAEVQDFRDGVEPSLETQRAKDVIAKAEGRTAITFLTAIALGGIPGYGGAGR